MKKITLSLNKFSGSWTGSGFTLIEILVVIAIIGILTSVAVSSFGDAKADSRDGSRVSSIAEITLVLQQYYYKCGREYPDPDSSSSILDPAATNGCPTGTSLASFFSDGQIPKDPQGTDFAYNVGTGNLTYIIRATLERSGHALSTDIDGTDPGGVTIECVDSSQYYCKGSI